MEKATKIMRSSIHSFFTNYETLASIATILVLPSSASTLINNAHNPSSSSSFLLLISIRNPPFFDFFYHKFLHTILSFLLTLPFTLTSLSLAKASVILAGHHRNHPSPPISSILRLYRPLALTQLLNSFLILSTNVVFFIIMLMLINATESLGFGSTSVVATMSAVGIIIHSMVVTNVFVVCNLASIVAAMENCRANEAVVKALVLVRRRTLVALSLALATNFVMAAIESVFQVRVMRPYYHSNKFDFSLICEGFTITYMYSIVIVLDVIITCYFYNYCKHDLFSCCESRSNISITYMCDEAILSE